jgi:uncharacterized protein with GYD domain
MFNVCHERGCLLAPRAISMENAMKRIATLASTVGLMLFLGLALPTGDAVAQQQTGSTLHRYLVRAELTAEGLRNLQKQPPTALKAGVAKFVESVGGKLEFWYFDYGEATAYSIIYYPDEIAAATAQLSTNSAGFARVRIRPLLSAEEMDKAVAKVPPGRVPQQQQ